MIAACILTAGDRVLISGQAGSVRASVVRVYERANQPRRTEAETFRNMALLLLTVAGVERAALVLVGMVPMFVHQVDGVWRDALRSPLVITPVEEQ